jgi:Lrp/AsnC family leucine-responsive transcriptional regulator
LPVDLDGTDIAILKSLMQDGRKSFRAISREIRVSTPTVKSRYERLVNIGLIKSVKPDIDLSKSIAERKTSPLEKKPSSSWRNKRSTSMQK